MQDGCMMYNEDSLFDLELSDDGGAVAVNDRERFLETMLFGKPDRVTYWPSGPRKSTLDRWHREGLPADVHWTSYLGLDHVEDLPIDTGPVPRFEEVVLEERGEYKVWIDELGAKRLDFQEDATPGFVTRQWLEFPVADQQGFLRMRERFNPHSPARYPEWWGSKVRYYRDRDFVVGMRIRSLFETIRNWMGFEGICTAFLDQPGLMHEMMEFVADFLVETVRRAVREVEVDYVMFNEDMAYKTASMISPRMVREFMLPRYKKVVGFLRESGVPVVIMDSDGHISELIPLWIEAGFNATYPLEVAAGNDLIAYRKRFGHQFAYYGGLDKRELARSKAAVEREVLAKLPWMLAHGGGYIPACDHGIPPDVPYQNYLHMLKLIRHISAGEALEPLEMSATN